MCASCRCGSVWCSRGCHGAVPRRCACVCSREKKTNSILRIYKRNFPVSKHAGSSTCNGLATSTNRYGNLEISTTSTTGNGHEGKGFQFMCSLSNPASFCKGMYRIVSLFSYYRTPIIVVCIDYTESRILLHMEWSVLPCFDCSLIM